MDPETPRSSPLSLNHPFHPFSGKPINSLCIALPARVGSPVWQCKQRGQPLTLDASQNPGVVNTKTSTCSIDHVTCWHFARKIHSPMVFYLRSKPSCTALQPTGLAVPCSLPAALELSSVSEQTELQQCEAPDHASFQSCFKQSNRQAYTFAVVFVVCLFCRTKTHTPSLLSFSSSTILSAL